MAQRTQPKQTKRYRGLSPAKLRQQKAIRNPKVIAQLSIERLKEQVDVVNVISSYIELKRAGNGNFVALCPFHNEKTPSFSVSPSRNIWHCFGCGEGGDSIGFVMKYENLSYPDALERVAEMMNFPLEYEKSNTPKNFHILEDITKFYQSLLFENPQMLEYIANRGITRQSIEQFRLGFSGNSFQTINFLNANNYDKTQANEFGLIGRDKTREWAFFIERLMFPIHSTSGKVVGFGGRSINPNDPAKYKNSPQSRIFNKSRLLYGYHFAKERVYKERKIIVCEGYIDVIMLHQAGFKNAVATLGTALNAQHIPLLKKGEPEVIVSYDGDNAGINAAFRAAQILSSASMSGGVVIFNDGLDPADMVTQGKLEELNALFSAPKPFIEFVIEHIVARFDITKPLQKQKALREIQSFLKTLEPLLQREYINFVAQSLAIAPNLIKITKHKAPHFMTHKNENLAESGLIMSLLENPKWLDIAVEYIDSSALEVYKREYDLLLAGKTPQDEPHLRALWVNDTIKKISSPQEFEAQLKLIIIKAYERDKQHISTASIQSAQKIEALKYINKKIQQLSKGELVSYESIGTF